MKSNIFIIFVALKHSAVFSLEKNKQISNSTVIIPIIHKETKVYIRIAYDLLSRAMLLHSNKTRKY